MPGEKGGLYTNISGSQPLITSDVVLEDQKCGCNWGKYHAQFPYYRYFRASTKRPRETAGRYFMIFSIRNLNILENESGKVWTVKYISSNQLEKLGDVETAKGDLRSFIDFRSDRGSYWITPSWAFSRRG